MWVQGIFGPVRPAATMATAFGGMFLSRNVLTIRDSGQVGWNRVDILALVEVEGRPPSKERLETHLGS